MLRLPRLHTSSLLRQGMKAVEATQTSVCAGETAYTALNVALAAA